MNQHTHHPAPGDSTAGDAQQAAEFWEARYADSGRIWSGDVNEVLADTAAALTPGSALDLGCGEGGDAIWLARQGWDVTGVDVSPTAVERGREAARAAGIGDGRVRFEAADLASWLPDRSFELVTSSFLQSWPVPIPRDEILRRAAGFVAPGGRILITSHAAAPSWAEEEAVSSHRFPTPESDLRALDLDPEHWEVVACELRERTITAPDGSPAFNTDGVVLAQRRA